MARLLFLTERFPPDRGGAAASAQKTRHVVGYMGDGINDAPALHAADVGLSVDTAVDVAKDAADFVLLKKDLAILRQGIDEGRVTFANTLKYILTTISANFGNMFSMAGASIVLPFLPLTAPQILLNNFLSDIPAVTIASDNVDPEMVVKPRRWNTRFIPNYMITCGLVSSVFDFLTFGTLMIVFHASPEVFRTGWFVESLLTELVIALSVPSAPWNYSGWWGCRNLQTSCRPWSPQGSSCLPPSRALACDPPLLLTDEPTGNLDTKSAYTIIDLFEQLAAGGKTVVMVTHDPSLTSRTPRNIIIVDGELIDETVARCLPWLRHRHLLEFTRLVEEHFYPATETIIPRNSPVDHFFMIRKGEVDVVLQDPGNSEVVISSLNPGEFFGEIELMSAGMSIADVRAGSEEPVELLVLHRDDFMRVIDQSPITGEALEKIVRQRLEAHRSMDPRKVPA